MYVELVLADLTLLITKTGEQVPQFHVSLQLVMRRKNHSSRTKAGREGTKRRDKKPPDRGNKRGLGSLGKQNVIKEIRQGWQRKGAVYRERMERKQRYCGYGCVRRCVRGRGGDGDFEKWSKHVFC
ncbi:hypothetical protein MHYP_G00359530 [Metynnis hypsauchen]